jgi:hypothetical protein
MAEYKDFGAKAWLYPQPVMIIATWSQQLPPEEVGACQYPVVQTILKSPTSLERWQAAN